MSAIKETNTQNMKTAMKSGDKDQVMFARNLHAAIRKKEIDDRVDLNDDDVIKIIITSCKQRRESIDQFRAGGREELAAKEEAELKYLMQFLPEQLSEDEIRSLVKEAIQTSGATSAKEMGKVMKELLPKVQGKADNKLVSQIVKDLLA